MVLDDEVGEAALRPARLEDLAETFQLKEELLDLVCECGDAGCVRRISMTRAEYEERALIESTFRPTRVTPRSAYGRIQQQNISMADTDFQTTAVSVSSSRINRSGRHSSPAANGNPSARRCGFACRVLGIMIRG